MAVAGNIVCRLKLQAGSTAALRFFVAEPPCDYDVFLGNAWLFGHNVSKDYQGPGSLTLCKGIACITLEHALHLHAVSGTSGRKSASLLF